MFQGGMAAFGFVVVASVVLIYLAVKDQHD